MNTNKLEIYCPSCKSYWRSRNTFDIIGKIIRSKCGNCFEIYETKLPEGFEVCQTCGGHGISILNEVERTYRDPCEKCDGNGYISWVDKVRR